MVKDHINPDHYRKYPIQAIDMMLAIFGKANTIAYCLMTAFKYRLRLGHKDNMEQELKKEAWYLNKAQEVYSSLSHRERNGMDDKLRQILSGKMEEEHQPKCSPQGPGKHTEEEIESEDRFLFLLRNK